MKIAQGKRIPQGSPDQRPNPGPHAERTIIISLRLSPVEMGILQAVVKRTGHPMSEVVRSRLFGPWDELTSEVRAMAERISMVERQITEL